MTGRSKCGMQVSTLTPAPISSNLSTSPLATGSLELKAEKQSAHSGPIFSVAFNHDGTKIVSGSWDKTIKVWDAGAPKVPELLHMITPLIPLPPPYAESLSELSKVENADPDAIFSVQFDPDGKTIVSGGYSGTLKVWDAGTPACPIAHLAQT